MNSQNTPTPDEDRFFDLSGLAKYSSLSTRTLQRYMKDPSHPLPHHRISATPTGRGRVLFSKREFDTWVKSFAVVPSAPPVAKRDRSMDERVAAAVRSMRGGR